MIAFMVSAYANTRGEVKTYLGMSHGFCDKETAERELHKTMMDYLNEIRATVFPGSVLCWLLEEILADPNLDRTGAEFTTSVH